MTPNRLVKSKPPDANRAVAIVICITTIVVCLAYNYWRGDMPAWWGAHGGGIPYVVFWTAFWFMVFPYRHCIVSICIFATTFTCILEFLQLWQPAWLMQFRSTRFGAALLGSGFTWSDFPPYFLGGGLGYLILAGVTGERKTADRDQQSTGDK